MFQVSSFRFQVSSFKFQVSSFRFQVMPRHAEFISTSPATTLSGICNAARNIMQFAIATFLGIIFLVSCHNPYPGFKKAEDDVYYKLLTIGELDRCCRFGDYVTVNISYMTMDDSVFFSGFTKFQVTEPDFPGSIDKCLTMMCRDDSAQFIISALDFYGKTLNRDMPDYLKNDDGKMKIAVKLLDIQTSAEYEFEKLSFLHWIEDLGEYEKLLLKQYIHEEKIEIEPTDDGIYLIEILPGEGPVVSIGDTITIHYEGYFLNERFFDSTRQRDEPLQFVYGQQWQVISGLEKALGNMRNGGKALVIMPSEEAFGTDGSVLGIVPPYTSVVFEIELINVKN